MRLILRTSVLAWAFVSTTGYALADDMISKCRQIIEQRLPAGNVPPVNTVTDFGYGTCGLLPDRETTRLGMHWHRAGIQVTPEQIHDWFTSGHWPDRSVYTVGGEMENCIADKGPIFCLVNFADQNKLWANDKSEAYLPQIEEFAFQFDRLFKNDLHQFEVFNEPDIFWPEGTPKQAADIGMAVARGIHRADPTAKVFSPCPSQAGYMESMLQSGLGAGIDGFSIHEYVGGESLRQELDKYHGYFKRFGQADKPIYVSETGYCSNVAHGTPEEEQAAWYAAMQKQAEELVTRYPIFRAGGVSHMFWYTNTDVSSVYDGENFGLFWSATLEGRGLGKNGTGWTIPNTYTSLKPDAVAVKVMGEQIGQSAEPGKRLDIGSGLQAYQFGEGAASVVLLWADRDSDVVLPVRGDTLGVTTMYGDLRDVAASGGNAALTVGRAPVYLRNVDLEALDPRECQVAFSGDLVAYPAFTVPLSFVVKNETVDKSFNGEIAFSTSPGVTITPSNIPLSISAGQQSTQNVAVKVVTGLPDGEYRLEWRVKRGNGRPDTVRTRELTVGSPIAIEPAVSTTGSSDAIACKLALTNQLPVAITGNISVAAGQGFDAVSQSVSIAPHGQSTVSVPMAKDGIKSPASLQTTFAINGGPTFATEVPFKEQPVVYRKGGIKMQGRLEDWIGLPSTIHLSGEKRFTVPPDRYKSDADLSADSYAVWDEDNLYLAFHVTDDKFVQTQTSYMSAWNQDGIQMALDIGDQKSPAYDNDDFEIALFKAPQAPFDRVAFTSAPLIGNGPFEGAEIKITPVSGGMLYECKMPWRKLGVRDAAAGRKIGFSFLVNDDDGDGAGRKWIEWTPGIGVTKMPSQFGDLRLVR